MKDAAVVVYCPRRRQHDAVCETPNTCAGGADCRLGREFLARLRAFLARLKPRVRAFMTKVEWFEP